MVKLVTLDERTRNNFERQIDVYAAAINALEAFKEVAKKFDGKVYNKRFREALKEAATNDKFKAYVSEKFDNVTRVEIGHPTTYVYFEFGFLYTSCEHDTFKIGAYPEDTHYIWYRGRIHAEQFIKCADETVANLGKRKEAYEKSIEMFNEVAAKYKEFSDEWIKFKETIPYPIRPNVHTDTIGYFGYFGI
jgi:hypothetical protein